MKKSPKNWLSCLILPLFLLAGGTQIAAQDYPDSTLLVVKLRDGQQLVGYVTGKTEAEVFFTNETVGAITIPRSKIRVITPLNKGPNRGQFWKNSPLESTYLVQPSGYGLKKGAGYFRSYLGLYNQINYGLTDHIAVGVGGVVLPLWFPTTLTATISAPYRAGRGSLSLTAGYLYKGAWASVDPGGQRLLYAVNTWGSRNHQLSVGVGRIFLGDDNGENIFYSFSYLNRFGGKWAWVSENLVFRDDRGVFVPLSLTIRYFARVVHFDFGLAVFNELTFRSFDLQKKEREFYAYPLPWLSISVPFVSKKVKSRQYR